MEQITMGTLYITILAWTMLIEECTKLIVAAVSLIILGVAAYAIYKIISKRRKKK